MDRSSGEGTLTASLDVRLVRFWRGLLSSSPPLPAVRALSRQYAVPGREL